MANTKQLVRYLERELDSYNYIEVAEQRCQNEAQTRVLLIEPFLSALGYDMMSDVIPEFDADFGSRKSKKVDYAIAVNSKHPLILVEAKKVGVSLSDKHAGQLNNYFVNTSSAKIGILTNGIDYKFYLAKTEGDNILYPIPFFEFSLSNYSKADLEELVLFHKSFIEPKSLQEEAEDRALISNFENAVFEEFSNPSDDFLKLLFKKVAPNKRLTDDRKERLQDLLNPITLKIVYERLLEEHLQSGNSGIITTADEKKAFHYIHAVLANEKKVDGSRITYRDQRTKFSIILDESIRNTICALRLSPSNKKIEIGGIDYKLDTVEDVLKYSNQLKARLKDLL